jgi:hypothetical protein
VLENSAPGVADSVADPVFEIGNWQRKGLISSSKRRFIAVCKRRAEQIGNEIGNGQRRKRGIPSSS